MLTESGADFRCQMNLDNARQLKADVFRKILHYEEFPSASLAAEGPVFANPQSLDAALSNGSFHAPEMDLAFGIAADRESHGTNTPKPQLAVLVRDRKLLNSALMDAIVREAKGELTKIFTGRARAHAFPLDRERPLRIGCSVGHKRVTAGTLGCFVATDAHPRAILSNNHVLARNNAANLGDPVLQPGKADGGRDPEDRIGTLIAFEPLGLAANDINLVDCALANVFPEIGLDLQTLPGESPVKKLNGKTQEPMLDTKVWKAGRTTGLTEGVVDIIELDQFLVDYSSGNSRKVLRFDRQIVVSGTGAGAFSKPGDSGSLVYDDEGTAIGLLFAGSPYGGRNGRGVTYCNPIATVLDVLDARIMI
jgi:hypothetical protein